VTISSAPPNSGTRQSRKSGGGWRSGDIYLDKYAGWYSVRDEAYYAEDETHLNEHKVRLSSKTGTPVEWVEEESYFFRLSAYQQKLLDLYARENYVLPKERLNEVASFVKGGLQDLSISRTTFDWGIRVPGNPKHIMYVWVDALTNYITAAGFPDSDSAKFKHYWPADLHVIGKDIVRFHAVYWPAFLMSAGIEVPRRIFSHGFLFNRGEKMSKSVGNVLAPDAVARYGVDPLRYFFLRCAVRPGRQLQPRSHHQSSMPTLPTISQSGQRSLSMIARNCMDGFSARRADRRRSRAAGGSRCAARGSVRPARGAAINRALDAIWKVSRTPAAISLPGTVGAAQRSGARRACSMSLPRSCARSAFWCSLICLSAAASISWRSTPTGANSPTLRHGSQPRSNARAAADLPAHCRAPGGGRGARHGSG
jgi:methionyl-tRNA synthetase